MKFKALGMKQTLSQKRSVGSFQMRACLSVDDIEARHRSSHRRCSTRTGALKNFANFTGKHRCWSLFLIKLQARPAALLKRDSNTGVFL